MTDSLKHYETLSLASVGPSTLPRVVKTEFQQRITNYIDDIDGATYKNKLNNFYNKQLPDLVISENHDKKILFRGNRPNSFDNSDIEGARYRTTDKMKSTNRHINPLEPEYNLSKVFIRTPTPPKFIRDTMRHDDIKGSSPPPLYKYNIRESLKIHDIEGTKTKPRFVPIKISITSMSY
jgi:hypothetical protein